MKTPPRPSRWFHCVLCIILLAIGFPSGCSQDVHPSDFTGKVPILRVLILQGQSRVTISATQPPSVRLPGYQLARPLDLPPGVPVILTSTPTGWQLGVATLGSGDLLLTPAGDGSVSIDGHAYRGHFRFIAKPNGTIDVVNNVDVEAYLRGVLPRELFANFAEETYKAQCVVARTYVIYEKQTHPSSSEFDVYSDERSQVYGGISAESTKGNQAVDETRGWVTAYGPPGSERIFKAYFSSCCGGAGQSAAEAFGDPVTPPLSATACGSLCSDAPRFTWPTVAIGKADLTHRIQHYGQKNDAPEKNMGLIARIDVMSVNAVGRPVMFTITDVNSRRYAIVGEELRRAVNTDSTPKTKVWSSFFQLENRPDEIRFVNGHGFGHGVGMCQWCAQRRAEQGMDYKTIVLLSFPQSKLVMAY